MLFSNNILVVGVRPVLVPLYGGLVDDEAGLEPHHGEVHVDRHGLLLVIDVADLFNHKPEVVIQRQRFVQLLMD